MSHIYLKNLFLQFFSAAVLMVVVAGCSDSSDRSPPAQAPEPEPEPEIVQEDPLDYLERSLTAQIDAIESGALDCEALVQAYVDRIALEDDGPEGINAMLSMVEDPAALAREVDASRGDGLSLQCGIIVLKDNIDMAGLPTTAGSLALVDNLTPEDAPFVARMREQGALLLGKTNLSEWANFRSPDSTSGWSSLGGQTRNGFDGESNPCGSSSGSAAAVAAGLVSGAVGTETNGSIVCPASENGVVGMKPTIGLVSRTNIIPISSTQDTAGPITRTVRDAARMLSAMAGVDQADSATLEIPDSLDLDFEAQLEGATLEGLRIGVLEDWGQGAPEDVAPVDVLFREQLTRIEGAGATLVPVSLGLWPEASGDQLLIFYAELRVGLNDYLSRHAVPGQPTSLTDLIIFNDDNADEVMPFFGQEHFEISDALAWIDIPEYPVAVERQLRLAGDEGILQVMQENDLAALVAPTGGPAVPTAYPPTVYSVGSVLGSIAARARYPSITVPMGLVNGLPVGLSVVAGPWQDATVLSIAHAYEQLEE